MVAIKSRSIYISTRSDWIHLAQSSVGHPSGTRYMHVHDYLVAKRKENAIIEKRKDEIGDPEFMRFKQSLIDQGANYETDEDYLEAFNNLVGYFDILIEMDREQKKKSELEEAG